MTDKEDDDNGEEKSYHGGVAAVVPGHAFMKLICSEKYPRISPDNVRFLYYIRVSIYSSLANPKNAKIVR